LSEQQTPSALSSAQAEREDPLDLRRFVDAQAPIFEQVRSELLRGRKRGHWMWFIFPQIAGLGASRLASEYAIATREEAEAYLQHPVLGRRLRDCTRLVNRIEDRDIEQIFGHPDNLKFRSCMTLFACSTEDNRVFADAVKKYFAGEYDHATLARLKS
jgi:uncharacterized protein (DUF1810 family)